MIQAYFAQIQKWLDTFGTVNFVLDVQLTIERRPGNQGFLKGSVQFIDGSELHFREYLDETAQTVDKLAYSYHYQDENRRLVFRYDNAQHKPSLPFRAHKHLTDKEIIAADTPSLESIMTEITEIKSWL